MNPPSFPVQDAIAKLADKIKVQVFLYALVAALIFIGAAYLGNEALTALKTPLLVIITLGFVVYAALEYLKISAKMGRRGAMRSPAPAVAASAAPQPSVAPPAAAPPMARLRRSWPCTIAFVLFVIVLLDLMGGGEELAPDAVGRAMLWLFGSFAFGLWGVIQTWKRWSEFKGEWMGFTAVIGSGVLLVVFFVLMMNVNAPR